MTFATANTVSLKAITVDIIVAKKRGDAILYMGGVPEMFCLTYGDLEYGLV